MARKPGGAVAKGSKVSKRAGASGSADAQRRKDPVFMKHLEAAILDERARVDAKSTVPVAATKAVTAPAVTARAVTARAVAARAVAARAVAVKPAAKARPGSTPKAKAAAPRKDRASDRQALAAELSSLIPELDPEGLAFLVEQARVHIYNMRVAELEDAAVEAERAAKRVHPAAMADEFQIHAAGSGSSYDLVWHDKWKMFTDEEMLAMVRITSNKDPVVEVGGRLYRWLLAERGDVLADIPFSGLADPKLKKLVALLRKTFTVKSKK